MAIDPAVPQSRRNVLVAAIAGLAGLVVGGVARPSEVDGATGAMVFGTSMDAGVDTTSLTAATSGMTAVFQNTGSGTAVEGLASGTGAAILGANTSLGIGVMGGSDKGNGIQGSSNSGNGVLATSTSGNGLIGTSTSAIGVIGMSQTSIGVAGSTNAPDEAAVLGLAVTSTGVFGFSGGLSQPATPTKTGLYGFANQDATAVGTSGSSPQGTGVAATSTSGTGIVATSTSGSAATATSSAPDKPAVLAVSAGGSSGLFAYSGSPFPAPVVASKTGVYGRADQDATAVGVRGESTNGTGVRGQGPTGVVGISPATGVGAYGSATAGPAAPTPPAKVGMVGQSDASAGVVGFVGLTAPTLPTIGGGGPLGIGLLGAASGGAGVVGIAASSGTATPVPGTGVYGQASVGIGVAGLSVSGHGVEGSSSGASGVVGSSSWASGPAILAQSTGDSTGLLGFSGASSVPSAPAKTGVYGLADQDATAVGVKGDSAGGSGVVGHSALGTGVLGWTGISAPTTVPNVAILGANMTGQGYDFYAGGSGRIGLAPNVASGPPTANTYAIGDVFCDAAGNLWVCVVAGTPGSFRKLAGPTSAGSLHPITPARVYDSRISGGPFSGTGTRTISVANAIVGGTVAPSRATAVVYNLAITATVGAGWLGLVPHGAAFGGTSAINWFASGQTLANGGTIGLGGDRQFDVHRGGSAGSSSQFIVDVTGFYL